MFLNLFRVSSIKFSVLAVVYNQYRNKIQFFPFARSVVQFKKHISNPNQDFSHILPNYQEREDLVDHLVYLQELQNIDRAQL